MNYAIAESKFLNRKQIKKNIYVENVFTLLSVITLDKKEEIFHENTIDQSYRTKNIIIIPIKKLFLLKQTGSL